MKFKIDTKPGKVIMTIQGIDFNLELSPENAKEIGNLLIESSKTAQDKISKKESDKKSLNNNDSCHCCGWFETCFQVLDFNFGAKVNRTCRKFEMESKNDKKSDV